MEIKYVDQSFAANRSLSVPFYTNNANLMLLGIIGPSTFTGYVVCTAASVLSKNFGSSGCAVQPRNTCSCVADIAVQKI